jgi:hypothetical protein
MERLLASLADKKTNQERTIVEMDAHHDRI